VITIRPIALGDAEAVAALRRASRDHLAPWEPDRGEASFTTEGVRAAIETALARAAAGTGRSYVIEDRGRPIGAVMLNAIVRGPYVRRCGIGYWVDRAETGRGAATEAVRLAKQVAFGALALDDVLAETLPENHASQKVLLRNGFEPVGRAPAYLEIAGVRRDHLVFQARNPGTD
jgi:ribosomal-protein-alanine N-acetyltransferase